MAGGVIATLIIGAVTLYTTHVLWQYCMKYPLTRDVCDVAFKCVLTPLASMRETHALWQQSIWRWYSWTRRLVGRSDWLGIE